MKRSALWVAGVAIAAVAGAATWLALSPPAEPKTEELKPTAGLPWFEDVTAAAGIAFRHLDSATPRHLIQETFGSGLGWIDFDADGWLDLFCVQAGPVAAPADMTS